MSFDIIRAVEACYSGEQDNAAWLRGVLETLEALDGGPGFYAELYRFEDGDMPRADGSAVWGGIPVSVLAGIHQLYASMPAQALRRLFAPTPPVEYILKRAGRVGRAIEDIGRRHLQQRGVQDTLWVIATEPDGTVALVAMTIAKGRPKLAPRTLHQLSHLSAHLSSAARLRTALAAPRSERNDLETEAVLDPSGEVIDAVAGARPREARQTLSNAVRRMESARGALRRADPEEALRLWQALIDGTWSLVDHSDSDGRRYLLARRNEPRVRDPKALTLRERSVLAFAAMGHQNKHIGYLLGISAAAVAAHLYSVQRKLGLSCRPELIQRFAPLIGPAASPEEDPAARTSN
jgi:DNA-binding CsgD family transcriptional regulator